MCTKIELFHVVNDWHNIHSQTRNMNSAVDAHARRIARQELRFSRVQQHSCSGSLYKCVLCVFVFVCVCCTIVFDAAAVLFATTMAFLRCRCS